MNIKKQLIVIPIALLVSVIAAPAHAGGKYYGHGGYYHFPFRVLIGFDKYRHHYGYKHRYKKHYYGKHHYDRHYYKKHNYKKHYYRKHHNSYKPYKYRGRHYYDRYGHRDRHYYKRGHGYYKY